MDFNIKPLGVSVEEFRNNPRLQIEAAAKLAEQFKSQFTEEDRKLAKEKGYSENALLAGAWLGGVGGVRKVLRGEGNPSDKHWSKEGKGTTVKDRMDKFNKMQEGGVLKCQMGDKFIITEYGSEKDFDGFILANETFVPKAYDDGFGNITIGYGLTKLYDKDLNPTPVKLGQTITEEEAKIQHERRKQLDLRQIKKRLPNFDLYPKGLQYAIRDMVFNSGETSTFNPNTKFMKALKGYDSSGDYSNWDLIRGIAKHIDWNLDTEGNLGVRAGMRRAMATEIYDWDDNKTIGKYHTNPKDKNYYVNSPYWQFGQLKPKTKGNKIKSKQLGGVLKCKDGKPIRKYYGKNISGAVKEVNGWDDVEDLTEKQRIRVYNKYNPSGNAISEMPFIDQKGFKIRRFNMGTPEEEAYWANYLGLEQDMIKPTNIRKPDGSDSTLTNAEFVGTPRNMDLRLQAIADTTYTGKLSRLTPEQYKKIQNQNPLLVDQKDMQKIYTFGKTMLDNPLKTMQAKELLSPMKQMSPEGVRLSGLGAFGGESERKGGFGMMWNDKDNTVNSWDTYDFNRWQRWLSSIPDRKTSLEIRSKVKLDPQKGSVLLRNLIDNIKK